MLDINFFNPQEPILEFLGTSKSVYAKRFSSPKQALKASEQGLTCHLITEPKRVRLESKSFEGKASMIAVLGGSIALNQEAVSSKKIGLLLDPVGSERLSVDKQVLELASRNNVSIGVFFSGLLKAKGFERAMLFKNLLMLARLCKNKRVPLHVFSGARDWRELRPVRDLTGLQVLLGFKPEQASLFARQARELLGGK